MRPIEFSKFGMAKFGVVVVIAAGIAVSVPWGFAQDAQPSVADAARAAAAAKKDKDKASAAKTVITDDSLGSGAGVAPPSAAGASDSGAKTGTAADSEPVACVSSAVMLIPPPAVLSSLPRLSPGPGRPGEAGPLM